MDVLNDEIESLEAILMDDVKITKNDITGFPEFIEITVVPTTGEEVERQYVCITLQVMPTQNYPDTKPNFKLRNPRGLDDNSISSIENALIQKLDNSIGQPVIFDLIDLIREFLTASNLPSGQCVICLFNFQEGDEFTKTACYHYLHSHCLACHMKAAQKNYNEEMEKMPAWQRLESKPFEALCPVCREPISIDVVSLENAKIPEDILNAPCFVLTKEIKTLQKQMAKLYSHQKSRGGIIDLNAEEYHIISLENGDAVGDSNNSPKSPVRTGEQSIEETTNSLSRCSVAESVCADASINTTSAQNSPQRYGRNNNYRGNHRHNRSHNHGHRYANYNKNNNNNNNTNDNGANNCDTAADSSGSAVVGGAGSGGGRHRRGGHHHKNSNHYHHRNQNNHDHTQQQQQSAAPVQTASSSNTR